jgi:WD40 repeat protein
MNASFTRTAAGHTLVGLSGGNDPMEVLDLQTGGAGRKLGPHLDAQRMALSRDGQWVATCGWHSDRVRLWNAQTGTMVHEWVLGKQTDIFFSPDSRALIIARGDSLSFWDVESLQLIRRIPCEVALYPSYVAFSPDGKLMAVEMAPAVIHLKEVATGRTVARLEDPHGDRANWLSFTPDGMQLVVEARYARAVHIWDLRAIRTRLKSMALDWDWPEFLPAPTPRSAAASM